MYDNAVVLAADGIKAGRDRDRSQMRRMDGRAIDQQPPTMIKDDPWERFPGVADFKRLKAVNQVLAPDIIYIPLHKGFL
jgi:hypothetical protein